MTDLLVLWFLNCAVVSCLLFWWFESTLPVLATMVARWFVEIVAESPDDFWDMPDQLACETMDIWTRGDWEKWRSGRLMPEFPKFAHLLGCSRCISFHFSYLTAVAICCLGTTDWSWSLRILFLLVGAFGSSTLAHRLIPNATSWKQK